MLLWIAIWLSSSTDSPYNKTKQYWRKLSRKWNKQLIGASKLRILVVHECVSSTLAVKVWSKHMECNWKTGIKYFNIHLCKKLKKQKALSSLENLQSRIHTVQENTITIIYSHLKRKGVHQIRVFIFLKGRKLLHS